MPVRGRGRRGGGGRKNQGEKTNQDNIFLSGGPIATRTRGRRAAAEAAVEVQPVIEEKVVEIVALDEEKKEEEGDKHMDGFGGDGAKSGDNVADDGGFGPLPERVKTVFLLTLLLLNDCPVYFFNDQN
ncbi:hypothetical protein LIER_26107 [Lithospermum erythrorhizon]|uniref:Uncharacterized protein n=1 Tax=Lithospermum erythrorhizon TaxID=34254 RepID=A0AAV3RAK9_LITER